ncbi:unnamed protein product [Effrenium voratum]|nr:unnamed protein product [Effrenium voratum]
MPPCPILAALCVGIEQYQCAGLKHLPGARDAENFASFLRENTELSEQKLHLCVGEVTKAMLEKSVHHFTQVVRRALEKGDPCRLLIIFVAAHGKQLPKSELPAILPSDVPFAECQAGLVDLDASLILPLDSVKQQKLKVCLVVDTCRENHHITTWTGNRQTFTQQFRWRSSTDFHMLLACDRGRLANDEHSLTDALIHALRCDPSMDWESACKAAQTNIEERSQGRQRPWMNSRGDVSNICLSQQHQDADLCIPKWILQSLMLAAGVLAGIIVVLLFWILLLNVDMRCTVNTGRYSTGCPDNSCFCTDCDPCNMYLAERHSWQWHQFNCHVFGLPLNRCWLSLSMNVWWLGATLRLGWLSLQLQSTAFALDRGQLLLVVVACGLNATSAISVPQSCLSRSAKLVSISLKYNISNTCLLAASISIVVRLISLQPAQRRCAEALNLLPRQFLQSFVPTVLFGVLCITALGRSTESAEEFVEQENKFYFLYLLLGVLFAWISWREAQGISIGNYRFHVQLKRLVWHLLIVKLGWCTCRSLHWFLTCYHFTTLTDKYNLFMILVERISVLQILSLIRQFTVLYAKLNSLVEATAAAV